MDLHWCFFFVFMFISYPNLILSDQNGFWSLSCGGATNFVDSANISWVSDNEYITKGNTTTVDFNTSLRFFPDPGNRKCYKLPMNYTTSSSSLILVRANFVYKNYDGLEQPPLFSVSLGTAVAAFINLSFKDPWIEEFIWQQDNKDTLPLCLNSIPNGGFPVISSIEIRPIPQGGYYSGMDDFTNKLLQKRYRINCGYTNGSIRYPLDQYDRIWDPDQDFSPFHTSTGFKTLGTFNTWGLKESPPQPILQTGRVLARREGLSYNFALKNLGDYYVVLYFAGILPVSPTFDVLINGDVVESNYSVKSWEVGSLYFLQKGIKSLNITFKDISFYPIVNAIEVYEIINIPPESSTTVVSALQVIRQSMGLDLEWEDDPCSPMPWEHIQCEGSSITSLELFDINLRSISPTFGDLFDLKTLDLHNTSLAGEIENLASLRNLEYLNLSFNKLTSFGTDLDGLINLRVLDLKNNSLEGLVPESFGAMMNLHLLSLENNQLQGTLPKELDKDSLEIRTSGNLCLSFSMSKCYDATANATIDAPQVTVFNKKKQTLHSHLAVVLGAVGGVLLVLIVVSILVFVYIRRKTPEFKHRERMKADLQMRNWNAAKAFSYKEIKAATRNFKQVLGRGSFGSVYLGKLPDGKLAAIKVRFDKTQLGANSFINEVSLLSSICHQNLVSLEGYCHEPKQQILVYEYLPGGSLADNIYGANSKRKTLSWVCRLKIAIDAAKGLDYLHNRSEPRIIHRDVKSSNILLDGDLNAKVCDFGLSKQVTQADVSHVTTMVKGTAGYLDPEYYATQQLTEKSDVYSFGVVLLELICGREPLRRTGSPDSFNLVLWAKPYLQAGAFEIVDESLKETYDEESMRNTASIASRSVDSDASQRPTIAEVLAALKEAYSIQLSYLATAGAGLST
ncbi:probable LRR receptor-like serine/threonine-protein kinase At5g48740 [Cynara cardunculus var. scolymus]|uniref:probable LRR receptor-like serine/threonine-protein kinase At5g48740 n=1 Tax=Cynara cardunculus var. scolymus TaxID=59895 RepID=UPI000D62F64A|nr:probable LRR receptor-like serine/threonine-protein kinase At5g48740 [Cynara cardunculus var. scolymus]